MKTIRADDLYRNVDSFLRGQGIELTKGCCPNVIKTSCELLSDAINLSQKGLRRTKQEIDRSVDRVREAIHEMTAPSAAGGQPSAAGAASGSTAPPPAPAAAQPKATTKTASRARKAVKKPKKPLAKTAKKAR